jgi:hypothetical protein
VPLYIAGTLRTAIQGQPDERSEPIPEKVRKNCNKYLPLGSEEELLLVLDETLLGSGKEGIAVTSERLLSYNKSDLKLNLSLRDLEDVQAAKIGYDSHGLVITRGGKSDLDLRITQGGEADARLIASEIQARLVKPEVGPSEWQCPDCGPGEVVYVPTAICTGRTREAQVLMASDLHICRSCGMSSLKIESPSEVQVGKLPDAEVRRSGG